MIFLSFLPPDKFFSVTVLSMGTNSPQDTPQKNQPAKVYNAELKELLQAVVSRIDKLEKYQQEESTSEKNKGKDRWDKVDIIIKFIASIMLVVIGFIFTYQFNRQQADRDNIYKLHDETLKEGQMSLNKIDAVAKLMPFVTGKDEKQKKIGLLLINRVTDDSELMRLLAEMVKGEGAIEALKTVVSNERDVDKKASIIDTLKGLPSSHFYTGDPGEEIEVVVAPPVPEENLSVKFAGQKLSPQGEGYAFRLGNERGQIAYLEMLFPLLEKPQPDYRVKIKGKTSGVTITELVQIKGQPETLKVMFLVY